MFRILRNTFIILAAFIGVVFAYFNTQKVDIDYLFGQQDMPLVLALAAVLLLGLVIGILVALPYTLRIRGDLAATRRRLQHADTEIKNLRSQPIHDA